MLKSIDEPLVKRRWYNFNYFKCICKWTTKQL
jgi:hypothetical protein